MVLTILSLKKEHNIRKSHGHANQKNTLDATPYRNRITFNIINYTTTHTLILSHKQLHILTSGKIYIYHSYTIYPLKAPKARNFKSLTNTTIYFTHCQKTFSTFQTLKCNSKY